MHQLLHPHICPSIVHFYSFRLQILWFMHHLRTASLFWTTLTLVFRITVWTPLVPTGYIRPPSLLCNAPIT